MVETRFRSLRIIATILKVLAWIVLAFGLIGALIVFGIAAVGGASYGSNVGSSVLWGLLGALVSVLAAALQFLFLFAGAEGIDLALAIEENTRRTAELLKAGDSMTRPL